MDDRDFDKHVRDKLSHAAPAYDEQTWNALQSRLALFAPVPWYSRWKSGLLGSALAVFTLINLGILWQVNEDKQTVSALLTEAGASGKSYYIDTLTVYDTIKVVGSVANRHSSWSSGPQALANSATQISGITDFTWRSSVPQIVAVPMSGRAPIIDAAYLRWLSSKSTSTSLEDSQSSITKKSRLSLLESKGPMEFRPDALRLNFDQRYLYPAVSPTVSRNRNPLDLRIGLGAGLLIPDPDLGERFISSRLSFRVETPLKRDLYLHTGINFQHMIYRLDDVDDDQFNSSDLRRYPEFETFTEPPDKIKTDNTTVQIPLYLRYYRDLNNRWAVYLGGGPTIDILLDQKFTYSFITIRQNQLEEFDQVTNSDQSSLNIGSLTGEFGLSHHFTPQLFGQLGLNYQYGIGNLGLEKRSFNALTFNASVFYQLGK